MTEFCLITWETGAIETPLVYGEGSTKPLSRLQRQPEMEREEEGKETDEQRRKRGMEWGKGGEI